MIPGALQRLQFVQGQEVHCLDLVIAHVQLGQVLECV